MTTDFVQCFHFNDEPVRGAIVVLNTSHQKATRSLHADAHIRALLGQCLAATSLMGVNLKGDALLSLQARGDGILSLIMAEAEFTNNEIDGEANQTICVRGTANYQSQPGTDPASPVAQATSTDLDKLLGNAQLAITISPKSGTRYQGIVPLAKSSLEQCLMDYFDQSEQLPTWLRLYAGDQYACGLFLQQMPVPREESALLLPLWEELLALSGTITEDELVKLPARTVLQRLFAEHRLSLQTPRPASFGCRCSKQKTLQAVSTFPQQEIESMLAENPCIEISCEFCGQQYQLTRSDLDALLPTSH